MKTISDERNNGFSIDKCDDCGKVKPVRRVSQVDVFTGENRGWFGQACFDCRRPAIKWITPDGRTMESSVGNPFNDDGTLKNPVHP
jgi:hypothetical protein